MRRSLYFTLSFTVTFALAGCPYSQGAGITTDDEKANRGRIPRDNTPLIGTPSDFSDPRPEEYGKKGLFLMNRMAPSNSTLCIANADGSNERVLLKDPIFEYHAEFSPDGEWITFTGERNGDGNSDIYRVRPNGSDLQAIVESPAVEDSVVLSPNGTLAAFVSTAITYKANIWVKNLDTGVEWNLTDTPANRPNESMMAGHFHPAWSPDGEWIAFSSDRNTPWDGHGRSTYLGLAGWEHTQQLGLYVIRPNGSDLRRVAYRPGYCLGSPKWSPDGNRLLFYEMTRDETWYARRPEYVAGANSTIVSIGVDGNDRRTEVQGPGVKVSPQYVTNTTIGYFLKAGPVRGLYLTNGTYLLSNMRSPSWSPDGKSVVYEKLKWDPRPLYKRLYSWDSDWDYRFADAFPQISSRGKIAITSTYTGNSSIVTFDKEGKNLALVYDSNEKNLVQNLLVQETEAGAYNPNWSPDGEWLVFGVGSWFQQREYYGGWIIRSTVNGKYSEFITKSNYTITEGTSLNAGFPSFSHDGKRVVYRVWGADVARLDIKSRIGLRIIDLESRNITQITSGWDNFPAFSPDGELIVFTRKITSADYDICTIRPDGSDLRVLTSSAANDAHAVWRQDGKIMWATGMYGFQYEGPLYDNTFQPYSQIMIMDSNGSNKRPLTNSIWEDSMPLFVPKEGF